MSDSGNYSIFEGLTGFVKGLETFSNALGKATTWYEENADIIKFKWEEYFRNVMQK